MQKKSEGENIGSSDETEALLRAVIDSMPDIVFVKDRTGRNIMVNRAALDLLGKQSFKEVIGKTDAELFSNSSAENYQRDNEKVMDTGRSLINQEEQTVTAAGQTRWMLTTKVARRDAAGKIIGLIGISRDITEKKNLDTQFLRAQRMESISRLASGIAHDLNNVLAPILISSSLLREKVRDKEGLNMLDTLEASAKRGADVVKQVLWFGRGLKGQRMPVNSQHLVKGVIRNISETFPKTIQIESKIPGDIWHIVGDPAQLQQVLINLAMNASDAMPSGGKLTIAARNFTADANYAGMHLEARPGQYVVLEISDTGIGIPHGVREQIFEPFFTTKELGKGTGLGLSTALSVVKSHEGFILVESEVGEGSTFSIYLPAQPEPGSAKNAERIENLLRGQGETILIVDDEEPVRLVTQKTLETFGYRVLLARDGAEAVVVYTENQATITVVLTDILMPVMNGIASVHALRQLNPRVKIIATSGFKSDVHRSTIRELDVKHFMPKPYTAEAILLKLREVIAEP